MRREAAMISNGTLKLPREVRLHLNIKEKESVFLELNEDGSVTIRRNENISSLKGIVKKGEKPELYANRSYQFEGLSKAEE